MIHQENVDDVHAKNAKLLKDQEQFDDLDKYGGDTRDYARLV